jgi:uncharacterized protein VirK/YbjX
MTTIQSKVNLLKIAKKNCQPFSIRNVFSAIRFLSVARNHKSEIDDFSARLSMLNIRATSEMVGTVQWPYIHNEWDVATKLNAIATHYEILSSVNVKLAHISASSCLHICNFDQISKSVYIGIDYAKWFTREGELVVNVFSEDLRVASMAFTLGQYNDNVVLYIGAVQGIHRGVPTEESLNIYKKLTKDFEGLRPRSLLLEVLKVVAHKLGVKKIFGVSEQNRHHRHRYFGNNQNTKFNNDYNLFWEEHNGILNQEIGFYEIPMKAAIKDLSEIESKKRSQYRRRYEIIGSLNDIVSLN